MNYTHVASFLDQHESIDGWFSHGAMYTVLLLMRMQLEVGVDGALGEIGLHHGKLTTFLAFFSRKKDFDARQLFAADLFEGMQALNVDRSGRGNMKAFETSLGVAKTRLEDLVVYVGPSQLLDSTYFTNHSLAPFRMFSVDGGHTRDTALSDLKLIDSHISDGGIVLLDDFYHPTDWFGVTEAAIEFRAVARRLVPFLYISNKLYYTTASHLDYYRQGLRSDQLLLKFLGKKDTKNKLVDYVLDTKIDWYNAEENLRAHVETAASDLLQYFDGKVDS